MRSAESDDTRHKREVFNNGLTAPALECKINVLAPQVVVTAGVRRPVAGNMMFGDGEWRGGTIRIKRIIVNRLSTHTDYNI